MKTTILNILARTCGWVAAITVVAGSIVSMTAADIPSGKGAAKLLTKQTTSSAVVARESMSCGTCSDKFTAVRDLSARGANQTVRMVAQHQCGGCSTTLSTVGVGKAKQNLALHTCTSGMAGKANCCARN